MRQQAAARHTGTSGYSATAPSRAPRPSPVRLPVRSLSPAAARRGHRAHLGEHAPPKATSVRAAAVVRRSTRSAWRSSSRWRPRKSSRRRCPAARCTRGGAGGCRSSRLRAASSVPSRCTSRSCISLRERAVRRLADRLRDRRRGGVLRAEDDSAAQRRAPVRPADRDRDRLVRPARRRAASSGARHPRRRRDAAAARDRPGRRDAGAESGPSGRTLRSAARCRGSRSTGSGLHPAFALVPIVPFLPHEPRRLDLFADPPDDDATHHFEHEWHPLVQVDPVPLRSGERRRASWRLRHRIVPRCCSQRWSGGRSAFSRRWGSPCWPACTCRGTSAGASSSSSRLRRRADSRSRCSSRPPLWRSVRCWLSSPSVRSRPAAERSSRSAPRGCSTSADSRVDREKEGVHGIPSETAAGPLSSEIRRIVLRQLDVA